MPNWGRTCLLARAPGRLMWCFMVKLSVMGTFFDAYHKLLMTENHHERTRYQCFSNGVNQLSKLQTVEQEHEATMTQNVQKSAPEEWRCHHKPLHVTSRPIMWPSILPTPDETKTAYPSVGAGSHFKLITRFYISTGRPTSVVKTMNKAVPLAQ